MNVVTSERWAEAQLAEKEFWRSAYGAEAFCASVNSLVNAAAWMQGSLDRLHRSLPNGDWVELGIGPLGLGCIHLLPGASSRQLVGVDPLEQQPAVNWSLPDPLLAVVKTSQESYEHVVSQAERTELESGRFAFAVLHNMLDHVQDPAAVLSEAHRLLRDDGLLLLACDTISLASRLRLRLYVKRRLADSLFVRAHPFHFRAGELDRLVGEAGFSTLATNRRNSLQELAGHSHRLFVLAAKR